ncbi:MAG: class I SAM-dependent methyltransferase [Actinomycetota bacterium]
MQRFFPSIVRPVLHSVGARDLLEIGADDGGHTALLQGYCADVGGHLTVVDPVLGDALRAVLDDSVTTFVQRPSLEALPTVPVPDVALIDGDHNHYTVLRELRLLAERSDAEGRGMPPVLLHDVLWPWGRRDMYYDPDRIPERHRHESDTRGVAPGVPGKVDSHGGFNAGFVSAVAEGGPANGVLTAVEDFVAEGPGRGYLVIPGLHGLAVVTHEDQPAPFLDLVDRLRDSDGLLALLAAVEQERLESSLLGIVVGHELRSERAGDDRG